MTITDRSPQMATLRDVLTLTQWINETIDLAERANQFDKTGHAQRAKELLQQARDEIFKALTALRP
jgi:hypothetical protein